MSDAVSQLAGLACCALGAVFLLAGVAHFFLTRPQAPRVSARSAAPDVNVELGLSLVALMRESDPGSERAALLQRAETAARKRDMAGLLAAADAWREAGGTPRNRGAFNDLRRAVDAVAAG